MMWKLISTMLLVFAVSEFSYLNTIGELVRELLLWEQFIIVVCVLYVFGYFVYLGYDAYKEDVKRVERK